MKNYLIMLAALITLHQPSGEIYVNPEEIMLIRPSKPPMAPREMRSAILVHDTWIYVIETPSEVKRLRDGGE